MLARAFTSESSQRIRQILQLSKVCPKLLPTDSAIRARLVISPEILQKSRYAGATFGALQFHGQHILRANRGFQLAGHGSAYIADCFQGQRFPDSTRLPRPCRRVARVWVVLAQLGFPVSSANVKRLPTILRTAISKRSASFNGLSLVARLL